MAGGEGGPGRWAGETAWAWWRWAAGAWREEERVR
ncbi:hypothetical protein E2C01_052291 [Portunus trituberculatus]|uniref:Uncharacterized protein n=1 Tax=Portunus trituberculatus TaxID=210409 RepID=A0A5B7GLJ7_PORTR|nr:hypothetical protein [Portunus trituberculatus]